MNAWLITWEGTRDQKDTSGKIVAILSSRKSEKTVVDVVESIYIHSTCNASDIAYYANRRGKMPFKVQSVVLINGIPHGDRIFCGNSDRWLYARRVSKFKVRVDKAKKRETLTWVEPSTYKWKGKRQSIELAAEGEVGYWERNHLAPLSTDTW